MAENKTKQQQKEPQPTTDFALSYILERLCAKRADVQASATTQWASPEQSACTLGAAHRAAIVARNWEWLLWFDESEHK